MLSVHTSPLDTPGDGDAGGMNVYVVEVAERLAAAGTEVEVFTRATSSELPPCVEIAPGVTVRHVRAGPYEGRAKEDLPGQLCAFTVGVLRAEARQDPGHYDLVHSHYWLSGQVGWVVKERWGVPLVHSMHTLARVKNVALAEGDRPEPAARVIGEQQVVDAADLLVANTDVEAGHLIGLYGADAEHTRVVHPGVDLDTFRPEHGARRRLGLPDDAVVLLFAGRIQPLKAPDLLLRAAAELVRDHPALRERLVVAVVGGPSGAAGGRLETLAGLAGELGVADVVRFQPPVGKDALADWYRAATVTVVPSYNESFGLVALESQACGTPVVAARVGGLPTAVADGVSGLLVDGHEPGAYAAALGRVVSEGFRQRLAAGALRQAARFSWDVTVAGLTDAYRDATSRHAEERARLSA
ncbi:MAG: D-inositol-3-phosphate glycosyltransferase [Streptosporangiales bacterium]|nr:D-inositol-3-phosphate glycosyltransferase [Streptosporangiales bacterium]